MGENLIEISVIIPCFNDGKYIQESINSVLDQTCQNFEIIVVNDGSNDLYTNDILSEIDNNKIIIIDLEQNLGPSKARNIAIKRAKGKYILPLDADDKLESTYLQKARNILDRDKSVCIVYCRVELFGESQGEWLLPMYSFDQILIDNMIVATAMFRYSSYKKVNGYNENMIYGLEDYDFWLSLIEVGCKVYRINEILFFYRKKANSRTIKLSNSDENKLKMYVQLFYNHQGLYLDNIHIVIGRLRELLNDKDIMLHLNKSKCIKVYYIFYNEKEKFKKLIKKIVKRFK